MFLLSPLVPFCICHILLLPDTKQVLETGQSHPALLFMGCGCWAAVGMASTTASAISATALQQTTSTGSWSSRVLQGLWQSWFCFSLGCWIVFHHFHCFCWIWCKVSHSAYVVTCSAFPSFCNWTSLTVSDPSLQVFICSVEANRHF